MSFGALAQPAVADVVERFAEADDVTLLVGAGASMEADLPSWPRLIQKLLDTVASDLSSLPTEDLKREWVERTLERDDLLGAGAVVEVMTTRRLNDLVPEQLYGQEGPEGYLPGPIAGQVAYLRQLFGERLEILTTNYDDLIEQALVERGFRRREVRSYIQDRRAHQRPENSVAVVHLHGLAGRKGPPRGIVLTEEHYHAMQRGSSWQERLVTKRLNESRCLFVGMSLTDPNLVRYLYGYETPPSPRHAAIFVRQSETGATPEVRHTREEAAAKRWARCGVQALFVDHYADAAQLLYEIGHRRERGGSYEPVSQRARQLIESVERRVLLAHAEEKAFGQMQVLLSDWLRGLLYSLLRVGLGGDPPDDEKLALALWLMSPDGSSITGWAHSDRAHQDPATVAPVEIAAASDWVAVRSVCQGARVELDRENYASRWRFVRALPLIMESPSRVPVGCLTIASTKKREDSVLTSMAPDRRAIFHESLLAATRVLIEKAST